MPALMDQATPPGTLTSEFLHRESEGCKTTVADEFVAQDIITNCRIYPKDEAPAAYKDFNVMFDSVKADGLATEVARLKARFVIEETDTSLKGAA